MIQITLGIDGRQKTFRSTSVRMRTCLDAYRLAQEYERCAGEYPNDIIEQCLRFITGIFGNEFTEDELLDGYEGSPFELFPQMLREVIGYTSDRIVDFPTMAAKQTSKEIPTMA